MIGKSRNGQSDGETRTRLVAVRAVGDQLGASFLQDFLGDGVLTGLNRPYEKKADPVLPRSATPSVPHG